MKFEMMELPNGSVIVAALSRDDFDALYAALSKTNQEPAVRKFLEAIRPCPTSIKT